MCSRPKTVLLTLYTLAFLALNPHKRALPGQLPIKLVRGCPVVVSAQQPVDLSSGSDRDDYAFIISECLSSSVPRNGVLISSAGVGALDPEVVHDANASSSRYIVVFKTGSAGAVTATDRLLRSINTGVQAATASAAEAAAVAAVQVVSYITAARDASSDPDLHPVSSKDTSAELGRTTSANFSVATAAAAVQGIDSSGPTSSSTLRGLEGVVLQLPGTAGDARPYIAAIKAFAGVAAVASDREIAAAVISCVEAGYLSRGVLGSISSTIFRWPGCWDPSIRLTWLGRRCGLNFDLIKYTALIAVDNATGSIKKTPDGALCVLRGSPTKVAWHRLHFGACGQAPLYARDLPTALCPPTSSGEFKCLARQEVSRAIIGDVGTGQPYGAAGAVAAASEIPSPAPLIAQPQGNIRQETTLKSPASCGPEVTNRLTYTGTACGPNDTYILWTAATTPNGCTLAPRPQSQQVKYNYYMFGSCGVPPGNAALPATVCSPTPIVANTTQPLPLNPSPSAPGDTSSPRPPWPPVGGTAPPALNISMNSSDPNTTMSFTRVPLYPGESVPSNTYRIEAVTSAGVFNTSVSTPSIVGLVDSGVDATHPDLNVVGGVSWLLDGSADMAAREADALTDTFGHGTHVAGIIAAKNNGAGIVGVSPGSPIYSLKVLGSNGKGSISSILAAVNWVLAEGLAKGIRVLNLSLATYIDPSDPSYADAFSVVCPALQLASDAGVLITVAAGNFASNMQGYLPASCPAVAAVTAVDAEAAGISAYSNWVPQSSGDNVTSHVIAAPGTNIYSTMSYARSALGYAVLTGTSMASPHIAGVAANCIMAGACPAAATGREKLAIIQAAAAMRKQRADGVQYGFAGDASSTINGKYMGNLVWGGMV